MGWVPPADAARLHVTGRGGSSRLRLKPTNPTNPTHSTNPTNPGFWDIL